MSSTARLRIGVIDVSPTGPARDGSVRRDIAARLEQAFAGKLERVVRIAVRVFEVEGPPGLRCIIAIHRDDHGMVLVARDAESVGCVLERAIGAAVAAVDRLEARGTNAASA